MPGGTDIFEVQGWQPQGPGRQPMVNLPIWPTESPPRLIGQIARCSQTPVVMWQRPSEKSDNVCKLLMLHVAGAPIGRGTERLRGLGKESLGSEKFSLDLFWIFSIGKISF